MDKKTLSKLEVSLMVFGVALLVVCYLLLRLVFSNMSTPPAHTTAAQNPYSFSSSSPLAIVRSTTSIAKMGTLVSYTGTLPGVGSCQSISVQTPMHATNPVHFAFVITAVATSSCADPNAPQTFTTSLGADSATSTPPILDGVSIDGTNVIYVVSGN